MSVKHFTAKVRPQESPFHSGLRRFQKHYRREINVCLFLPFFLRPLWQFEKREILTISLFIPPPPIPFYLPPFLFPSTKALLRSLLSPPHLRSNEISWVLIKDKGVCATSKRGHRKRRMSRRSLKLLGRQPPVSVFLPLCVGSAPLLSFKKHNRIMLPGSVSFRNSITIIHK